MNPTHTTTEAAAPSPIASAATVRQVAERLRATGLRCLAPRPIADILRVLAETVEAWLHPDSPWRRRAEAALPAATGFSAPMIRHGLRLLLEPLRGDAIGRLLDTELAERTVLDRISGPPLMLHIVSGNIPALAAVPIALSLAVKSAALVKESRGDRVFPPLFIESLRAIDGELGSCAASLYWMGGRVDVEVAAFAAADLVVAAGDDATIADITRRVPGRFIGHGHRISFAVIAREARQEAEAIAARLAYDVAVWDQQGCLSPQLVYVERGGALGVERFAAELCRQLELAAIELPPRQLSVEDAAGVLRFRQEAEWRAVRGEEVLVLVSPGGTGGTVVYDAKPAFVPTPLNRTVWVKPVDTLAELPPLLAPARPYLEAAGLAAPPARQADLSALLTRAGVHRLCPLGEMQRPDLTWRPGGRPRVAQWVGAPFSGIGQA
ncbi:MAG: hypothetical protein HY699_20935 [Deltaproteobacteria bacterium]|nr:hypothetical protein [Deltaproteobacteria bacterium]